MKLPDCVELEMRMAVLMAEQERSGFRFDMGAADRVRQELEQESNDIREALGKKYIYVPGKVFTPRRKDRKNGYESGCPMTKLLEFNPTSRQHIAWVLQTFRGARFTKLTDTGKPKVDEATLSEIRDVALQQGNTELHDDCEKFIRLLTIQKWIFGSLIEVGVVMGWYEPPAEEAVGAARRVKLGGSERAVRARREI